MITENSVTPTQETPENSQTKKVVRVFSLASFLHDVGADIVFSVWPIYITTVLGANMQVLGLIDGLGDAMVSVSQAISGYISDKLQRRKIFVWLGYFFGVIARLGYALVPAWQYIIPFRLLDRSGKIRASPRDAILTEVSKKNRRGTNFGILHAMDNFGAIVGITISLLFVGTLGYRNLFMLAAIPSVLATLMIILFIKDNAKDSNKIFKGVSFKTFDSNIKLYTILSAVFSLGAFSYSFLLISAKDSGFSVGQVPLFYLIFTFVAAVASIPAGKLADKFGRKKVLYFSFVSWITVMFLIISLRSVFGTVLAFIFYGLHKGALDTSQRTLIADLAPKEYLSSTLGGFQMIVGLCSLPASFFAGLLWDKFGMLVPFYVSIVLSLVAVFMLKFVKESKS